MNYNSRLFDRIRIKPQAEEPREDEVQPRCQHPGCALPGPFRAPMGRGNEGRYLQFCLDHVREYNASYNYFAGMNDEEVAAYQKDAVIGHRPTWSMGVNASGRARTGAAGEPEEGADPAYVDPFGLFDRMARPARRAEAPRRHLPPRVKAAFETLGLEENAEPEKIKTTYKTLVKRFHPDANGGDRSFEARLQEIIRAYGTLKTAKFV